MSIFDTSAYANSLMGGINMGMKLAQEREAQRQYEQEQAYRQQQDAVAGQRYDQEWAYRQQRDARADEPLRWRSFNPCAPRSANGRTPTVAATRAVDGGTPIIFSTLSRLS